jgi:D-alanyl-D-alanine carboxypeptidase
MIRLERCLLPSAEAMQKKSRRTCYLIAAYWLAALSLLAQQPQWDREIEAALKETGAPSASVAIVQGGSLVYARASGLANIAEGRRAETTTRYAVGSISKQFTAAAILLAQEAGRLSLDDKVAKYFPDLTRASDITIRELLSHTSGYEDYAPQDYLIPEWTNPTTPKEILDRWAKKPLNFDPGTKWQYSNTNYVLAGEIFEKATGHKLVPFLREHIFDPLGMTSPGDCENHAPGDASSYTRFALGPPRPVEGEASGWYFAAGELCMTASDLSKWDIAFLQKKILSAKSYEEFTREVKLKDGKRTHYALGLSVDEQNGMPVISHSGEVSGFLAMNTVFPTKGAAVVVLSNEDGVNLIGPLSQSLSAPLIHPPDASDLAVDKQVRSILESLVQGRIDRSLLTSDASSYFSEEALADYRTSLSQLGEMIDVTLRSKQSRGGMTHYSYRAAFEKKSVLLNIYLTTEGKFEQFLVEEAAP